LPPEYRMTAMGEYRSAGREGNPMSYYKHHVFFCCNKRDSPDACCAAHDASIDEIIDSHVVHEKAVERLKI